MSSYVSGGYIFPVGNTCMGYKAGTAIATTGGNVLIGWEAGSVNPVDVNNVAIGYQAGHRLSVGGSLNVFLGYQAAVNCLGGSSNVAIGQQSGTGLTTGSEIVAIGPNAGQGASTSIRGVFVGSTTGINLNGNNNTGVGFNAGSQASAQTYSNTSSFGANAVPTASNQVTLGDSNVATVRAQVTTITALSDIRYKKNLAPLDLPFGFLDDVAVVSFDWKDDAMHGIHARQVGVIAQQLDEIQNKYNCQWLKLVDKSNPDRWEATPGKLLFPLIQRVQHYEARLKALEARFV
jgi:hypothetical protein